MSGPYYQNLHLPRFQVHRCPICGTDMVFEPSTGNYVCRECVRNLSSRLDTSATIPPREIEYEAHEIIRVSPFDSSRKISSMEQDIKNLEKKVTELELTLTKLSVKAEESVVDLRSLSLEEALPLIKDYIEKHSGCRTSEIILELELEPDVVLQAIKKLREEGEIRSEQIRERD